MAVPEVSIIIPAYNESRTITTVLAKCLDLPLSHEIIVVDNGSTDGTPEMIQQFIAIHQCQNRIRLLVQHKRGKGNALRHGIANAVGQFILFQDADLEYDPQQIPRLVAALRSSLVVTGCRTGRLYSIGVGPFLANKVILALLNRYFRTTLSDILSGQRGYRREVLLSLDLRSEGFQIETEMSIESLFNHVPIEELPVPYEPRDRSNGKKIGSFDFIAILALFLSRLLRHTLRYWYPSSKAEVPVDTGPR